MRTLKLTTLAAALAATAALPALSETRMTDFIITDPTNITLANSQIEVGLITSENPDVTGGLAFGPTMLSYTPSGSFSLDSVNYGADRLNDGDVGEGNPSSGLYAIIDDQSTLTLDFGGTQVVQSIALYPGYSNRLNNTFVLKDGDGNVQGGFTLVDGFFSPSGNAGVKSVWLTFDTPVVTDKLLLEIGRHFNPQPKNPNTSFREIQVFAVPEPGSLALMGVGMLAMLRRRRR